ncbi:HAD family hydrolase [Staphylococcus felis]|uniref:HAD family phosphatase n=1 Tax=Staphylococcus felis TaxID=46127 RepID=A0ABS0QLC9_9STAP|nr:HAD family phosphatase [Staphylococcus felis]MBH9579831.1 HAD family phosphatase [Staphylococcus felis]MDM8326891.1 HAD family phosphatase [Staphylococcus felis]MDQ7192029.1 HAD family phosphatase [Staphylococcus felis]REH77720.1 HAD family phosphatase [Staphylococcus felis]REI07102.1 HAD family phosphatase [Staphylococcus felis]
MRAIIFDMDGVIVDTEIIDYDLQIKYLKSKNSKLESKDYSYFSELIGLSYTNLFSKMAEFLNHTETIKSIEKEYSELEEKHHAQISYKSLFREDIVHLLRWSKSKNVKLAVVSSSTKKRIINVLEECEILGYFDLIISGEDFTESKPNPEIYLTALKCLGLKSSEVIVIEDSYYGIEASKNALIKTIAYKEQRMPVNQSRADFIFDNMNDILSFLKN